ncbi:MAG: DUF5723 family protein [Bacteroidales bacterium]|nr:DUF5723 family protein [Bacteroidales bacterium]
MKRAKRTILLTGFVFSVFAITLGGQVPNTLFFMPGVPQSNKINPAIQPACSFYLGLPGAAPLRLQLSSSSLAYSDVIFQAPASSGLDSLITPFHPLADKEAFLDKLKSTNFVQSEVSFSLASIGIRARKSFFTFDINSRVDASVSYPKGLFELPIYGIRGGETLSLNGFGLDMSAYNEIGLGWSRADFFIPNLTIGVRGKALFGLVNIATRSSVLELSSSTDPIGLGLHSDMEIAASTVPILVDFENYEVDLNNLVAPPWGWEGIQIRNTEDVLALMDKVFEQNFGMAMDLGLSYQPVPQLLISASMIDIGYIKWNNSVIGNYKFDYEFDGLDINPFEEMDTTLLPSLLDSLGSAFILTQGEAYMSRLNSKLFIGASYYPIEKIGFGLLSRTDFLSQSVSQQFTGSVNMTTGKFLNLSVSASYMQRRFNNLGAGLSVNLGPLNMYLLSDNIISAGLRPIDARSVNLWFGANLTFGWKRSKRMKEKAEKSPTGKAKKIDMPLIY